MNIRKIQPTASVALADQARQLELNGKSIIKLQTGDPDFATHPVIIEAAHKAMLDGFTHYSFAQGIPQLRKELADQINRECGATLDERNILVTQGAAEGMYAVFSAILELDDEVIILEPNWPTVDSLVTVCGGKPVKVSFLDTELLFQQLEEVFTNRTVAICINTPNNPTGMVLPQPVIDRLFQWAEKKGIYFIADEVYRFLQYDTQSSSLPGICNYDKYIFIDSFSKKYAMTGWRIGYVAANRDLLSLINRASQLAITHVNVPTQFAALTALTNTASQAYCSHMLDTYANRRAKIVDYCNANQVEYLESQGAFYFFIRVPVAQDDKTFAADLLSEKNVCVVPGSAYGKSGEGYFRITYATELHHVLEGLGKITATNN